MLPDPREYSIHSIEKDSRDHYVIEPWDDIDERGICPCGEIVVWNAETERWDAAPEMRVILVTDAEIDRVDDLVVIAREQRRQQS
jgi:hypothetical protein